MKLTPLKKYARKARHDFAGAVAAQARLLGLTPDRIEEATRRGDVLLVGARIFPIDIARPRQRLVERIARDGFAHVMDEMAYTWFNRLAAIRFMELNGYLDHGLRVLSHPDGRDEPEILRHAHAVTLPGLDQQRAIQLKLEGGQDEELFRLILLAQCSALHQAVPELFGGALDESALLLPANLLHSDSVIRCLVEEIEEDAWRDIEIIGWLYQFYVSERKDEVMGTKVASEDIPAATQLFTPDWIVKFLVQNSLGALWTASHASSQLRRKMPFYVLAESSSGSIELPPPPSHI